MSRHGYGRPRADRWECTSIFDAYERYWWRFKTTVPSTDEVVSGASFQESYDVLGRIQAQLRDAMDHGDARRFLDSALSVLRWGGVLPHNRATLVGLGDTILEEFAGAMQQLQATSADTDGLSKVRLMNAGFTKIYALLLDGFPIYDGRAGAALGYLVRLYGTDAGIEGTPSTLRFAWGAARGGAGSRKNRNPSSDRFRFSGLRGDPHLHARCNLMAAWLLGAVSELGPSGDLPTTRRIRALEAALFMIGYEIPLATKQARALAVRS